MKRLQGKVAVVTGAAMGMGRNLSEKLLRQGCVVALVDVNGDALVRTHRDLAQQGACRPYVCDLTDRRSVYDLAAQVERDIGPAAILVNNAGIVKAALLVEMDDESIEKTIGVNLLSMFWTCRAFLPAMIRNGEGHIVNMASAGGLLAIPNLTAYCASKFGVVGFSDALRQEMKKMGHPIGVTFVCPNTVDTGMFAGSRMVAGTRLLRPDHVTDRIIRAVQTNRAFIAVPSLPVKWLTPFAKLILPVHAMDWLNRALGMANCNDAWKGRGAA